MPDALISNARPLDAALRHVLVLDGSAAGPAGAGLIAALEDDETVAQAMVPGRGAAEHFAPFARDVLAKTGWSSGPEAIVAVAGPGSFTGLRAALALAHGLGMGFGCVVVGVTLGDALRAMPGAENAACVSIARRNRCFVDDGIRTPFAAAPDDVLLPAGVTALVGDAAPWFPASRFPGAVPLGIEHPDALAILRAARSRVVPAQPFYIDPPEARLPQGGLRPAPAE